MVLDVKNRDAFFENFGIYHNRTKKNKGFEVLADFPLNKKECLFIIDLIQDKITYERGVHSLLGFQKEEICCNTLLKSYHPDDFDMVHTISRISMTHFIKNTKDCMDSVLFITYRCKKKDGTIIRVLSRTSIYETHQNHITGFLIQLTDITFMGKSSPVTWDFEAGNLDKEKFKQEIYKNYNSVLTERETEIVGHIIDGMSNKDIANKLCISYHTVATHRKHLLKKTDCHNVNELIAYCTERGML